MFLYSKFVTGSQMSGNDPNAKMMQFMSIWMMPIMMFFICNNLSSGLSYYYLVSLLITIGQTFLFRLFVDDEKLLRKIEENKKKPQKKSGFMARLEKMQREQMAMQREQAKRRK